MVIKELEKLLKFIESEHFTDLKDERARKFIDDITLKFEISDFSKGCEAQNWFLHWFRKTIMKDRVVVSLTPLSFKRKDKNDFINDVKNIISLLNKPKKELHELFDSQCGITKEIANILKN